MRLKSFTLIILAFSVAYIANSQATKEDITGNRSEQQVVPYKLHDADKTGEYARHQHFNRMLSSHDREIATNNIGQRNIIAEECDTLHYPLAGTPTLFFVTDDGGYVCGNNIYGDLAKADLFEPQDTGRLLYKGFFELSCPEISLQVDNYFQAANHYLMVEFICDWGFVFWNLYLYPNNIE
jgi:hypothetical protein